MTSVEQSDVLKNRPSRFVKIGTPDVTVWRTVGGIVFVCALIGALAWWIGIVSAVTN